MTAERRICAREDCTETFNVGLPTTKRYCSERCQRIAERRRYREHRTEQACCPNCGEVFTRTATSKRLKVFCSALCLRRYRSADYKRRGIRPPRTGGAP